VPLLRSFIAVFARFCYKHFAPTGAATSQGRSLAEPPLPRRMLPPLLIAFTNSRGGDAFPPYGVGDGLLIAGWGVAEAGAQLPKPVAACCRAAVPTLLRIARPIAA
jgi:hypothetical protein